MRKHALTLAPWCILAVVLFAGAAGEKPIPEYMRLMLLEEAAQTKLLQWAVYELRASRSSLEHSQERIFTEAVAHSVLLDSEEPRQDRAIARHAKLLDAITMAHDIKQIDRKAIDNLEKQVEPLLEAIAKKRSAIIGGD